MYLQLVILLTEIRLRNFKSIQKDDVQLRPLTIFTGPNSSGKSNIMQAIAVLSQIGRKAQSELRTREYTTLSKSLEGETSEFYRFPRPFEQYILYKGETERQLTLEIHFRSRESQRNIGYAVKYVSEPKTTQQQKTTQQLLFLNRVPAHHTTQTETKISSTSRIEIPTLWRNHPPRANANQLLNPESFISSETKTVKKRAIRDPRLRRRVNSLVKEIQNELERVYLLSAPRGIIPTETQVGPDPTWVGKNGQDLIYILSRIYGQTRYKSIQNKISEWAEKFGIGNIGAGLRKGSFLGADFEDPRLNTIFDMTSSSYGSRQLLTIITQIFWCNSGDILLIEEPEISLHPGSQVLIQELFAEAISDGKQIICATHSPFFVLSLSKVIGKKTLSKKDVVIYHVDKDTDGTTTRKLDLSDKGFVKDWIPSFLDVENKLFSEWVESLD